MAATLEVEVKFPVTNLVEIESRLARLAGPEPVVCLEIDSYFNAPDRDFARSDEALRLRRIGEANLVTYKGPKRDSQTKTRLEIEVALADGDQTAEQFKKLLLSLGYRFTAQVSKRRRLYHLKREPFDVEICLDEVEEVGTFLELEVLVPEDREGMARTVVLRLAEELGLEASERRSYLEMLLAKREKKL
jgi:adenylate cyclase, class 2